MTAEAADAKARPGYLGEFSSNWRAVLATALGFAGGVGFTNYLASIFVPPLMREFGWSGSQMALLGVNMVVVLLSTPIAGRLTDKFGVRNVAAVGVVGLPLCFFALSFMSGDVTTYFLLNGLLFFVGAATSAAVYTRVVAERFTTARGLAFALVMSASALSAALLAPILSQFVETHGWRAGYQALGAFCLMVGAAAILLMPRARQIDSGVAREAGKSASVLSVLMKPAFAIILAGMFLCNLPNSAVTTQLQPLLLAQGLQPSAAAAMISFYAGGIIAGRFLCGFALDRFQAELVAAIAMGVPAIGFAILGFGVEAPALIATAVALMGLSQGGEGDIAGYLAAKHLGVQFFSTALGLVIAAIGLASALGAIGLSVLLRSGEGYQLYLLICGGFVTVGALTFLLLPKQAVARAD